MHDADTWVDTFFSGNPPKFVTGAEDSPKLRKFCPVDDKWNLAGLVDKTRLTDESKPQVFWLRSNGRRKYVAKVVSTTSFWDTY